MLHRLFQYCCLAVLLVTGSTAAFADWYALAISKDVFATAVAKATKAEAVSEAMTKCKTIAKGRCIISGVLSDADDPVIARSPATSVAGNSDYIQMVLSDSLSGAIDSALRSCQANSSSGTKCETFYSWISPKAARQDFARKGTGNDCRPKTGPRHCKSQCVNGDCTVMYQNGCTTRVQVSPVFNGYRNAWEYPAPSC